jgi:hypothetical protein
MPRTFTLFLSFLTCISDSIGTYYIQETELDPTQFDLLHQAYGSLQRLYTQSEEVCVALEAWERSNYYGREWSQCQSLVKDLHHALMVLERDLGRLPNAPFAHPFRLSIKFYPLPLTLRMQVRGPLRAKNDVLTSWIGIMRQNAEKHFCGWETLSRDAQWQKRLLIPAYSLLLTTIATATLADFTQSSRYTPWGDHYQPSDPAAATPYAYLPEVPAAVTISDSTVLIPNYAMAVVVPDEGEWLAETVAEIRTQRTQFGRALDRVRTIIVAQTLGDITRLLPPLELPDPR